MFNQGKVARSNKRRLLRSCTDDTLGIEHLAMRIIMMKIFWSTLVLAVLVVSAGATNYTVKAGGGGNYTTIQACANATNAGDTCTVYAGTYNETPSIRRSGTGSAGVCTACITFTVNPGDTV